MTVRRTKAFDCGDPGSRLIAVLVVAVAAWLLALPVSSFVQTAALDRFHLQSRSFVAWALQAPVPAMYSFRNRFRIVSKPWDAPGLGRPTAGTLNHFPVRLWTFFEGRVTLYDERARIRTVFESTYRGHSLTTAWWAETGPDGAVTLFDEVGP